MEYRRLRGSTTWHWRKNCANYPASKYEVRYSYPTSGEICDECIIKDKVKQCRK